MSKEKVISLLKGLEKVIGKNSEVGQVIEVEEFKKLDLPNFDKKEMKVNGFAACHILKSEDGQKFIVPHGLYFNGLEDVEFLDYDHTEEWEEEHQMQVYELIQDKSKTVEKINSEIQDITKFFLQK